MPPFIFFKVLIKRDDTCQRFDSRLSVMHFQSKYIYFETPGSSFNQKI